MGRSRRRASGFRTGRRSDWKPRLGWARRGMAWLVQARARAVRSGESSASPVRIASPGVAPHGRARLGLARRGPAWRGKSKGCSQRRAFGLASADPITWLGSRGARPGTAWLGASGARQERGLFAAASFRARQCGSHRWRGLAGSGPARPGRSMARARAVRSGELLGSPVRIALRALAGRGLARPGRARREQGLFAAASFRARQCGSHHPARLGVAWLGVTWQGWASQEQGRYAHAAGVSCSFEEKTDG